MAKTEYYLHGDFDEILGKMEEALAGHSSVERSGESDFRTPSGRFAVRVYEKNGFYFFKYSSVLTFTLAECDGKTACTLISAGDPSGAGGDISRYAKEALAEFMGGL